MAAIYHDLWVKRDRDSVFKGICRRPGLNHWWTLSSEGEPILDSTYRLYFGEQYNWKARVSRCNPPSEFEWTLTHADSDWLGTRVGFDLSDDGPFTKISFYHLGWPSVNDHFKRSSFCWAMYLRVLKQYLEKGEIIPYNVRTSV